MHAGKRKEMGDKWVRRKKGKGGLVKVFPWALKVQYAQTVVCFHCSQITAWRNVVLFRGQREGLLREREGEKTEKGDTHTHKWAWNSFRVWFFVPIYPSISWRWFETVRLPKSFCSTLQIIQRDSAARWRLVLQHAACSPLEWIAMFNRKKCEVWMCNG